MAARSIAKTSQSRAAESCDPERAVLDSLIRYQAIRSQLSAIGVLKGILLIAEG
jgi:hypothetical protein